MKATAAMRRVAASLVAGGVAIGLNTAALKAADFVPLATARGGLLRLITPWLTPAVQAFGIGRLWVELGGPATSSSAFQTGFHLAVGLLMSVTYAFLFEWALPGPGWCKGLLYALAVWILNAALVLPATGEGFAGSAHLSWAGMVWFAAAHTMFFVALGTGFALLTSPPDKGQDARCR